MEKRKKRLLTVLIIAAALLLAAVVMGCVDYDLAVNRHERPECAVGFATYDDGGSGRYYGLGYGFEVYGNFVAPSRRTTACASGASIYSASRSPPAREQLRRAYSARAAV